MSGLNFGSWNHHSVGSLLLLFSSLSPASFVVVTPVDRVPINKTYLYVCIIIIQRLKGHTNPSCLSKFKTHDSPGMLAGKWRKGIKDILTFLLNDCYSFESAVKLVRFRTFMGTLLLLDPVKRL